MGPVKFPLSFCSVFSLHSLHCSHEDFLTVLYTHQSCFYLMAFLFTLSSNSVNASQITSLSGRFFLWPLDIKCHSPPFQSLPEPSSSSLLFIYVYMKYTILYMKYIILFIHFDFCPHSLQYINSVKSRFLPVLLTVLFPLLKKYLAPSNSFIIIY